SFFTTLGREESWKMYILIGCLQVNGVIIGYFIMDKIFKGELLIWSLPVKRTTIIYAKYIFAGCIAVGGMLIMFLNMHLLRAVSSSVPPDFYLFYSPYVVCIELSFFVLFISVFLPITAGYKKHYVIMAFAVVLGAVYIEIFSSLLPGFDLLQFNVDYRSVLFLLSAFVIMGILSLTSLNLSARLYSRRDL
ncbi:ABC-2 transporter permease, partial [candidate division KSB1 bacterium]